MSIEIPTIPGTPFAGGFFVARYVVNSQEYALIDSGAAGELHGSWGEYGQQVEGADSDTDGQANTTAMSTAGSPIAQSAQALRINGHDDWYLPSRYEQALQYFALLGAEGYQDGQSEAFETDDWYWSSTQCSPDGAWGQYFGGGTQYYGPKVLRPSGSCRPQIPHQFIHLITHAERAALGRAKFRGQHHE